MAIKNITDFDRMFATAQVYWTTRATKAETERDLLMGALKRITGAPNFETAKAIARANVDSQERTNAV
jgi:hypothetical protein